MPRASAPPYDVALAAAELSARDEKLAALIARVGPCRLQIDAGQSPFDALLESIIYQQLHGKAAATIYGRMCRLFAPRRSPRPGEIAGATVEQLRSAGLSINKARAVQDLAAKTLEGIVPAHSTIAGLPDDDIVERLTAVRGVGRWTVEMLLIFRLGRADVLPVDDFGVRKGFMNAYRKRRMPTPKELGHFGRRWAPYRSVASWYLWRAADLPKPAKPQS
ncbi:MAG: DNA-3-methyladenine glycosylase 2 family protein [Acidobacteriota bacterium]